MFVRLFTPYFVRPSLRSCDLHLFFWRSHRSSFVVASPLRMPPPSLPLFLLVSFFFFKTHSYHEVVEAEAELEATREVQRRTVRDMRAAEAKAKLELAEARESSDVAAQAATVEKTKLEGRLAAVQSRLDELVSTMTASTTMPQKLQQGTFGGGMLSPLSSPIATHTTPTRNGTKVGSFMDVTGAMIETPTILNMSLVSANHQMKMGGMGRLGIHALHDDIDTDIFGSLGLQPGHQPMQSDAVGGGRSSVSSLGGGGAGGFVVQLEKLHLTVKQRESEALAARERLRQVEEVRDALTLEVQELGKRNYDLEILAVEAPKLRKVSSSYSSNEKSTLSHAHTKSLCDSSFSHTKANASLKKKNLVLLELLGEKTEEMEEIQADLLEAKKVYKVQLKSLFGQRDACGSPSG